MNEPVTPTTRRTRRRPRKIRRTSEPQNPSEEDGVEPGHKPEEKLSNTDGPELPELSELKEETGHLNTRDGSKPESSLRRRPRRRPRKLAIRRVTEGEESSTSINPQRIVIDADASVEERVTVVEHRVEEINDQLESTTLDVSQLQSGRLGQRSRTEPNLRIRDKKEVSRPPNMGSDEEMGIQDDNDSDIEEISRPEPELEQSNPRPLVLRGDYEIPLPRGISTNDVHNIRRGAAAAGSIARTINASFRSSTTTVQETRGQRATRGASNLSVGGSWSGLLSQASSIVTGAMSAVEMNATVESRGSYRVQQSSYSASSTARSSTHAPSSSRPAWNAGSSSAETVNGGNRASSTRKWSAGRRKPAGDKSWQKTSTESG